MTTTTISTTPSTTEGKADQDQGQDQDLSFENSIALLRKSMLDVYLIDEDGQKVELSEEQMDTINVTIDRVVEESTSCFEPVINQMLEQVANQEQEIAELEERLSLLIASIEAAKVTATASSEPAASTSNLVKMPVASSSSFASQTPGISVVDGKICVPTLEWLAQARKTGKTGDLTGFNIFTMAYSAAFKLGRPPAGVWKNYDQKEWKALATAYNSQFSTGKAKKTATGATAGSAIVRSSPIGSTVVNQAPISAGAIEKPIKQGMTTYMYWRSQYHKQHGVLPDKGLWAKVPKAEVESLSNKLAALKAAQA